jgi:hypothetical protein
MRNHLASIGLVLAACAANVPAQPYTLPTGERTVLRSAAPFPWPLSADSAAQVALVRHDDVLRLLREIYMGIEADISRVNFRFAPLVGDKPYLLVWHDFNGSRTDGLTAIYCQGNTCFHDILNDGDGIDPKRDLIDIDGDGAVELVGRSCVATCIGADRAPIYTYSIYTFIENKGFMDVSSHFVDYYKAQLLPLIEDQRKNFDKLFANRPPEARDPEQVARARVGVQYAYDDYLRRVVGQRSAGLENALQWVGSDDFEIRGLGFYSLERIPDAAAEAKLEEIAKSSKRELAEQAAAFLRSRAEFLARSEVK